MPGIMTVTDFVTYFVKITCLLTGNKSWMMTNTKKYRLMYDSSIWFTCASLAAFPFAIYRVIIHKSTDFILLVRMSMLAVSVTSGIYNLVTRKRRYFVEKACSNLVEEYGRTSNLYLLFIPFAFVTAFIQTVALNKDKTFMLVMLCYVPSIANEFYINLRTLAIAQRFTEISTTLSKMIPSNTDRIITSSMEAHRDCSKLVEMLNGCHMLDYFLLSSIGLIRNIYIIISVFQDVKNGRAAFEEKYAVDMITTFLYLFTVSGRFFLTCWSGTHLTITSELSLESALNYKFYHYTQLKHKSKEMVDIFIHQLQERTVSLSVFGMFDLGLGTFATLVEVTLTYAIVVVNAIGAKTIAEQASNSENTTATVPEILLEDR